MPLLKELNPQFLSSFQNTQNYLRESQSMAEDASIMIYQQVAQEANDDIHFNLKKLKQLPNYRAYLYQWLREFGFTDWKSIYELAAESQSGKQILSAGFRLLRNRHFLILNPWAISSSSDPNRRANPGAAEPRYQFLLHRQSSAPHAASWME